MSIFRKVVGFLFEEEEEVTVEGELEKVEFREEPKEESIKIEKKNIVKEVPVAESVAPHVQQNKTVELPKQEKHFVNIEIDDDLPKRANVANNATRKVQRSEPVKNEFEFTPVISPIFGADEKTVRKAKTPSTTSTTIHIPTAKKKSAYETILSPIFGATMDDVLEESQNSSIEQRFEINDEEVGYSHVEDDINLDIFDEDDDEQNDMLNVPLEDLLTREDTSDNEDDLLQFSLFGDDEIVKTEKTEDSYTIKD